MTKSSIEMAKTIMRLAKMAGTRSGISTRRSACKGEAPRSCAASSYSGPIERSRPRTTMTTKEIENVTCPRSCAVVPSSTNRKRWTKVRKRAVPITISGVTIGNRLAKRAEPAPRPRQRVSESASATPRGTAMTIAREASSRLWKSASRREGSFRTESSGSCQYQRVDHPWAVLRERPSLNEKRTAIRIGRIDHAM
jgi:hypothetical protein